MPFSHICLNSFFKPLLLIDFIISVVYRFYSKGNLFIFISKGKLYQVFHVNIKKSFGSGWHKFYSAKQLLHRLKSFLAHFTDSFTYYGLVFLKKIENLISPKLKETVGDLDTNLAAIFKILQKKLVTKTLLLY